MYDFSKFRFGRWNHSDRTEGMCAMEAVAFLAGEPHTDKPRCACPVIGDFVRRWNDGLLNDAERGKWLGPFVWRLINTRADKDTELHRIELLLNWLARERMPAALDLVPELASHARACRKLPEITLATCRAANRTLRDAQFAAWAVERKSSNWGAVRVAFEISGCWAAYETAHRASRFKVWDTVLWPAWASIMSALCTASWRDAAVLKPFVARSKKSAAGLLDRMIRLTEPRGKLPRAYHRRAKELLEQST